MASRDFSLISKQPLAISPYGSSEFLAELAKVYRKDDSELLGSPTPRLKWRRTVPQSLSASSGLRGRIDALLNQSRSVEVSPCGYSSGDPF